MLYYDVGKAVCVLSDTVRLKKSFWGFNESQVLDYISKMQDEHTREIEDKRREMLELSSRLEAILRKMAQLQAVVDDVPQRTDDALVNELSSKLNEANEKLCQQQDILAKTVSKLAETGTKLKQAEDALNSLSSENGYTRDLAEFEAMNSKISETEQMLREAEARASEYETRMAEMSAEAVMSSDVEQRIGEIEVKLVMTEAKLAEATSALAERDAQIADLQSQFAPENASSRIGQIFIEAQNNAVAIAERAEQSAAQIRKIAADTANKAIDDIDGTELALKRVKKQMEELVESFTVSLNTIYSGLKSARTTVERVKSGELDPSSESTEMTAI